MRKLLKVLVVLICPLYLCSCATIMTGRQQKIAVNTIPAQAKITINGMVQLSPCYFVLDRQIPSYQIIIEKEGYKPVTVSIKRGLNGWVFGNLIWGGLLGVAVDCISGSVYSFSPSDIEQSLVPEGKDCLKIDVK